MLIPFDIELALANPDRVVYRDHTKPLEWHYFEKCDEDYKILSIDSVGQSLWHTCKGNFDISGNINRFDLFLLPEVAKKYWANVYDNGEGRLWIGAIYESKKSAIDKISSISNYIKTIQLPI